MHELEPLTETPTDWVVEDEPAGTFRVNRTALTDEAIFQEEMRSIFNHGDIFMTTPRGISTANNSADRSTFENFYDGTAPWDIGKPQKTFTAIADRVAGRVLDAGCGTGEHALFFAARGHRVTGIDFVEEALRRARAKAAERGLAAEFLVKDATTLGNWGEWFASVSHILGWRAEGVARDRPSTRVSH